MSSIDENYQWLPEHDELLSNIASTDTIGPQLDYLARCNQAQSISGKWNAVKRIDLIVNIAMPQQNTAAFLANAQRPPTPSSFEPINLANGGLKLPPFPPRPAALHINETPVSCMTEDQANELKGYIFAQLDTFDAPPFTIQRVCELCVNPRQHYKSVGKYLRAVEKSLLVTSAWDSFPPISETDTNSTGRSVLTLGSARQSAPSTPLFSPIPFLHDDARRSKSRSPPPSPLALTASASGGERGASASETRALGLVDELDDPSPGHLSERPKPISSVTTVTSEGSNRSNSRPLFGSLDQRFIKAEDSDQQMGDEDKENTGS